MHESNKIKSSYVCVWEARLCFPNARFAFSVLFIFIFIFIFFALVLANFFTVHSLLRSDI